MADKDRRKKDGQDRGKDRQAMREGGEFKERAAHDDKRFDTHDPADIVKYKSGSPSDRTRGGAR